MTTYIRLVSVCLIISVIAACNSKDATVKEYPKKIVGRWVVQKQTAIVNAFAEGEKVDSIVIDESQYYKEANFKPAEIDYGAEGTYLLVIKNYNDEIKLRRPGLWKFNSDTLIYMGMDSAITDKYYAEVTDSTLLLKQKFDYDGDGKTNDAYEGFYRKLIR